MAEEAAKPRIINLLPRGGETIVDQFLSWALTIGRLLVIIVETLALSVFLYRFTVDVQIIDLHDKIEHASIIVANYKQGETTYRDLHERLSYAKEYDAKRDKSLTVMKDIIALGAGKVTFINIIVNTETVEVEATAPSATVLSIFTSSLSNYHGLQNVSVNRVENKTSSAVVTVGISAEIFGFKKKEAKTGR